MRKVALILIFTLLFATPALAAGQQASQEQAKAWNQVVLDYYEGKYGESADYENDYVSIDDWTILDVDSSGLEATAQEEIAQLEKELADVKQQASELQVQLDYFNSLSNSMEDEDYKAQIEPIVKDTERSLKDAQKEIEGIESEIQNLEEQEYLNQVAVTKVEINFGGNVLGTMTHREDQFINPENGEMIDTATAKGYEAVNEFLDQQPQVEQQAYHHETVGLFFLALGLGGWWFVVRKL